jgi:hypothetical protein
MSLPTDVRETTPLRPMRKPASARPKRTTKATVWRQVRSRSLQSSQGQVCFEGGREADLC